MECGGIENSRETYFEPDFLVKTFSVVCLSTPSHRQQKDSAAIPASKIDDYRVIFIYKVPCDAVDSFLLKHSLVKLPFLMIAAVFFI
jgi:hypothetical protein